MVDSRAQKTSYSHDGLSNHQKGVSFLNIQLVNTQYMLGHFKIINKQANKGHGSSKRKSEIWENKEVYLGSFVWFQFWETKFWQKFLLDVFIHEKL